MQRTAILLPLSRLAALAAAAALLSGGCQTARWADKVYENVEELDAGSAVIEETGRDAESARQRREELRRIAAAPKPPYRIGPGDRIDVRVYGHDDLGVSTRVGPDGAIGMFFIGQVSVSGKTIAEARDAIQEGLAPYVKHPVVGVTIPEVSSETVTVSGAVARPGLYPVTDASRLADVFAQAGGGSQRVVNGAGVDMADLERSILVREGEILPVDFRAAIETGDALDNLPLRKGDYVYVAPRTESAVTVCGDVQNPHRRLFEPGLGLVEALTAAGWMLDSHWSHVIVIRNGLGDPKMYKVDVDGVMAGTRRNVPLQPNDIVYVPKDEADERGVFSRRRLPAAPFAGAGGFGF